MTIDDLRDPHVGMPSSADEYTIMVLLVDDQVMVAEAMRRALHPGDLAVDAESFAASSVALLHDDSRWRRKHLAALERQRGRSWDDAAQRFEGLIP